MKRRIGGGWRVALGLAIAGLALAGCGGEMTPGPSGPPVDDGCVFAGQTFALPSDRFVEVRVTTVGSTDRAEFIFEAPSSSEAGPPEGVVVVPIPPFTLAGSGEIVEVAGENHVQLTMSAMYLFDQVGTPTYDGPATIDAGLPAIRELQLIDAFEGQIAWIVGYDGDACPRIDGAGNVVILSIDHPGEASGLTREGPAG